MHIDYGDIILNTFPLKIAEPCECSGLTIAVKDRILGFPKVAYAFVALSLRLAIAPFLSHPFEERSFMAVGASVAKGITPYGQYILQVIFAATPHPHLVGIISGLRYPPPWGLLTGGLYLVSSALAPNNLYAYVFALKLPVIIGELALAVLVYYILKQEESESTAMKGFLVFLFCPFILMVGTVWGMFDTLSMFFTLFSAWSLQENWKISAIFLSFASVLSIYPLILAPLYAILLYKNKKKLLIVTSFFFVAIGLTVLFAITPMFVHDWTLSNMCNTLTSQVNLTNGPYNGQAGPQFPYGTSSPFSIFTLLSMYLNTAFQPPSFLMYLWIPACLVIYVLLARAKTSKNSDFSVATTVKWSLLLVLAFVTTRAWVSEQNLVFLFACFALTIIFLNAEWTNLHILWIILTGFLVVHVPAVSLLWMPYPWTLDSTTAFEGGTLGFARLLMMTIMMFCWLILTWNYVVRKLKWKL